MFRINVWHIVRDHFRTLRLIGENEMYKGDKFTFFFLPFLGAAIMIFFDISLKPQVGNLIKALAIFGAFLFNLLAVIHGQLDKIKTQAKYIIDETKRNQKAQFAREIHTNITFCILLSVVLIVLLLVYDLAPDNYGKYLSKVYLNPSVDYGNYFLFFLRKSALAFTYWVLLLFGLTLLMVLNRVYILMREEESIVPKKKKKKKKKKRKQENPTSDNIEKAG